MYEYDNTKSQFKIDRVLCKDPEDEINLVVQGEHIFAALKK